MLSISIYLRPVDQDKPLLGEAEDWQDVARYCFEGGTVVGVLSYLIVQQGGEILNQGLVGFLKQTVKRICLIEVNAPFNHELFDVFTGKRTGQIDLPDFQSADIGLHTTENNGRQTDGRSYIGVRGTLFVVLVDVFRRVISD